MKSPITPTFIMDLQLFADGGDPPPNDPPKNDPPPNDPPGEGDKHKTYTQEELDKFKANWEKEQQQKIDQAKKEGMTEAERLASMTEEERVQETLKKLQEENEQYKTKEQQTALEAEARKTLEAEQLPQSFVGIVLGKDAETTKANIATFKEAYTQAVQKEVEARLAGKSPSNLFKGKGSDSSAVADQVKNAIRGGL